MNKPTICIIGPGIVGQATGKVFAAKGYKVAFLGGNISKIQKLREEGYQAYERGDLMDLGYDFDISMLTVPTPTKEGKINLEAMESAATDLGKRLANTKKYHLVVVKSTVPPGTTENLVIPLVEKYSGKKVGKDFGACMNPEYLREETSYDDTLNPWIILIGEYDKKSGDILEAVYKDKFTCPMDRCKLMEAEMQKYVHNLFNAAKISFYNEMREIAGKIDIDADKIFKYTAISCEGMWNPKYGIRNLGPFQGSCLPKDTQAFYHWATTHGFDASLLKTVIDVNNKLVEELGLHEFAYETKNIL
ncbi:MAG: hypothetical protein ACD_26C00127G0002 [uncultured bacterium]|nr:MAG: hypothetical protein ACD_26C00127G0002 [uncultured bacterium]